MSTSTQISDNWLSPKNNPFKHYTYSPGGYFHVHNSPLRPLHDLESISAVDTDYRYQSVITLEHVVYEESSTYSQYGMLEDNAPVKAGPPYNQLQDLIDQMTKIVKAGAF